MEMSTTQQIEKLELKGRCFKCGRYMKRGLFNWMDHLYDQCPKKNIVTFYGKTLERLANDKIRNPR